jgi:HNH endonuclease
MAKHFNYKIIDSKPLKEGAEFILSLPVKKTGFNRKVALATLSLETTKCACCDVVGTKFCLGQDNAGGKHWDLYSDEGFALTIDHILPKANGGTNHISNLQIMCLECNNLKMHHPERIEGYKKLLELLKGTDLKVLITLTKVPFLRVGYWKQLSGEILSQIDMYFREESIFDEDCGWLYTYYFKH